MIIGGIGFLNCFAVFARQSIMMLVHSGIDEDRTRPGCNFKAVMRDVNRANCVSGVARDRTRRRERGTGKGRERGRVRDVAGKVNKESHRVYYGLCCVILVAGHRGKSCAPHAMGAPPPAFPSLCL